ncbi:MAG: hypothetical protein HDQ88_10460 [Clostridia bacterium]|nr:hypothetical protein [Clostridia bacterium]
MSKLMEVGDRVRVLDVAPGNYGVTEASRKRIGTIGTVESVAWERESARIVFDDNDWWSYPWKSLQKVGGNPEKEKIQVGDYVRVLRMWEDKEAYAASGPCRNSMGEMDNTVGAVGKVIDIGGIASSTRLNCYKVEFDAPIDRVWYYPGFALEKVTPGKPESVIDVEAVETPPEPVEFGVIDSHGLW